LKDEERADLERVLAADELLDAGHKLVQRFRVALYDPDVNAFKQWLLDAAASELKPFPRLAAGMTDDLEALTNAFGILGSTHAEKRADLSAQLAHAPIGTLRDLHLH
jgi:transposase